MYLAVEAQASKLATRSLSVLSRAARSLSTASDAELHYRKLSRMYRLAPVNAEERYHSRVSVGPRKAVVTAPVRAEYTHSAGGLHGSSYFKMLDDAAFFAAQSINTEHFVVTTSFTTYITRVVTPDVPHLVSTGTVTSATKSLLVAEAVVCTPDGTEVGRGSGTFMPHPKFRLDMIPVYEDPEKHPFTEEDTVL